MHPSPGETGDSVRLRMQDDRPFVRKKQEGRAIFERQPRAVQAKQEPPRMVRKINKA